jgi:hypothetical protein
MCFNGYIGRLPISRLCLSMTSVPVGGASPSSYLSLETIKIALT